MNSDETTKPAQKAEDGTPSGDQQPVAQTTDGAFDANSNIPPKNPLMRMPRFEMPQHNFVHRH